VYRSAAISGGIPLYPAGSAPERHRLVILMIEVEQPEGVSTRKLVLETARHNVITAYSTDTGLRLLRRFPNVDVVVVHTELDDFCIPPGKRRHFKQMLGLGRHLQHPALWRRSDGPLPAPNVRRISSKIPKCLVPLNRFRIDRKTEVLLRRGLSRKAARFHNLSDISRSAGDKKIRRSIPSTRFD